MQRVMQCAVLVAGLAATSCGEVASADPSTGSNYYCRFSTFQGGHYYVQVFNLTVPGKGMCGGAEVDYSRQDFQNVPGLKRRCNLDRPEQIKSKAAMVSIYSDSSADSVAAARLMCSNTGNAFTE